MSNRRVVRVEILSKNVVLFCDNFEYFPLYSFLVISMIEMSIKTFWEE